MIHRALHALLAGSLLALQAQGQTPRQARDQRELLAGVERLSRPGEALPGPVLAFGADAFPIVTQEFEGCTQPLVAAARWGKGRVLAFGHPALYAPTREGESEQRFLSNALAWLSERPAQRARCWIISDDDSFAQSFESHFKSIERKRSGSLPRKLSGFDLIIWHSGQLDAEVRASLDDFVRSGGGLMLGVCPWGVDQGLQQRGQNLRDDLPENQLLLPMGLVFGLGYGDAAHYQLGLEQAAAAHAGLALQQLQGAMQRQADAAIPLAQPTQTALVAKTLRSLPPGQTHFAQELLHLVSSKGLEALAPRAGRPASPADPLTHLGFLMQQLAWANAPPELVGAAPGAEFFPGAVPGDAERVERLIEVSAQRAAQGGWISTGLYAVPGEPLEVQLLGKSKGAAWRLRIGAHQDTLWHKEEWLRWPEITLERTLLNNRLRVASPFGGLLYLVPPQTRPASSKPIQFQFSGVVEAPYYRLGDPASQANWRQRRLAPAPWAELECDGLVLSVPAGAVRELDEPDQLMEFWQQVMDCYPELRGEPQPERAERLVEDIQISAGWMHSGYPVMTHGADDMHHSNAVNLSQLSSLGDWGYFHEFGHNAQKSAWTFAGTGEVTNNLFSLFVTERMTGIKAWDNAWLANQKHKVGPHLAAGAPFEAWKQDPGLALMMYARVQHEFGWEPIQRALAAYVSAPSSEDPKDDAEKRQRWMLRLSEALQRDLTAYFELWGIPLAKSARSSASKYPQWLPAD